MEDKTALVIGGSSGIGFALAQGLAQSGIGIAIAARTQEKVETAAEALKRLDPEAHGLVADVTKREEIERLGAAVAERRGVPDILINCQGTTVIRPAVEIAEEDYDRVMDTNLRSVFFCCTILGGAMLERQSGAIINIASLAAHRGWPSASVYSMSKHGILGLTRTLAAEWAQQGVRVNSISPGFFLTELNRDKMPEARKRSALMRTPTNRFGKVEELVGAARYLASDTAGFVTGTDIAVDGGYLAGGI
ncbi:SDR family NAD(P)-dependent oxidoreductase [Chelativorans sp. YIM 93263]|uniref:SDR family NAD(P)-dependent oxidoreductase n=1 Tax=Chelativorans sp. YIM 93263 TaxID=2906648 RepID=UPI002379C88D|nr:SDR family oxidoreductase [Chelativorans sp. YIM 93263]